MPGTVLLVTQRRPGCPGRLVDELTRRGFALERRCPLDGDTLPTDPAAYAAVVVLGGPMSANDDLPGIHAQLAWLPRVVTTDTPLLGVCLGAQLLTKALGGEVCSHPQGRVEIGYYPVYPTPEGEPLFDGPLHVYHWHGEGLRLPAGAVRLAGNDTFPNQAFRINDKTFGVQFHAEVTREIMEQWMSRSPDMLALPGAQSSEQQRLAHTRHHAPLGRWLTRFIDHWLGAGN